MAIEYNYYPLIIALNNEVCEGIFFYENSLFDLNVLYQFSDADEL